MKRLLTEADRKQVRSALWADIKRMDLPRKARLHFLEVCYLAWLQHFNEEQEGNGSDKG